LLLAVRKKLLNRQFVKRVSSHMLLLEPLAQVRNQPEFLLGGEGGVSLLRKSPGKPGDVECQRASVPQVKGQEISTARNGHRGLLLTRVVASVRRRQPNYAE
jgi:hypothetical protein